MTTEYTLVALDTYGKEMVFDPTTRQRVSALKCTRGVPDILLALFRESSRDLTPSRSQSYRYIALDPMPTLKKSYLVLRLTPDEVTQVEALCKVQSFPWVYRWRDGKWWIFPGRDDTDYRPVASGSSTTYPRFPATAAPIYVPSKSQATPSESAQASGLTLEQSGDWWWIGGDTYPHREALRAAGAKWAKRRQQWYFIGAALPTTIQALVTAPNMLPEGEVPSSDNVQPTVAEPQSAPENAPLVEPPAEITPVPTVANPADLLRSLPLKYIGHVSIVGDCFCFGLAVEYTPETHRAYPVYVNLCGAATSVEAAWARLVQGKELLVTTLERNATSIYLHPPEKGLYVRIQRKIEGLGMDNLILLHRQLAQPVFTDADLAFLAAPDQALACARLVDYVRQMVKIAVFPAWGAYLRQQGYRVGLLTPRTSYEGLAFWTIKADGAAWTQVICDGLRKG